MRVNDFSRQASCSGQLLKRRKLAAAKGVFMEFCRTTPLHGFKPLLKGTKCQKATWLFLIGCAAALVSYQISKVVAEYIQFNTAFDETVVKFTTEKFPDVVVCDVNTENFTALQHRRLVHEVTGSYTSLYIVMKLFSVGWDLKRLYGEKILGNEVVRRKIINIYTPMVENYLAKLGVSYGDFMYSLTHNLSSVLTFCFRGKVDGKRRIEEPCDELAETVMFRKFGYCYLFRGTFMDRRIKLFSDFAGLLNFHATLQNAHYKHITWPEKDAVNPQVASEGHFIGIKHHYDQGLLAFQSAAPAVYSMLRLMPTKTRKLNLKRRPCSVDQPDDTTKEGCQNKCEMEFFIDQCNCTPMIFRQRAIRNVTPPECSFNETIVCLIDVESKLGQLDACHNRCFPSCTTWSYKITESRLVYPGHRGVWENTSNVQIFITRNNYAYQRQYESMTLSGLVGNVGGLFGIYLGGSILAILHCLWQMCETLTRGQQVAQRSLRRRSSQPKVRFNP